MLRHTRRMAVLARCRDKYRFYDLVLATASHPQQPLEALLMTEKELHLLKQKTHTTFEGNYKLDMLTPEQRIARVFGGRIKGEDRQSSSRVNVGEPRYIAGVLVPDKPTEPDNCCMSGCINCVWEMYNDDIKDWNAKRKRAAELLVQKGGVWPADFHPPIKFLKPENLPQGLSAKVREAPQAMAKEEESWNNVPVQIRVFAEVEKRLKQKRRPAQTSAS